MRRHILDKLIYGKNKNNIVRKVKTNVREMRISEKIFRPKIQINQVCKRYIFVAHWSSRMILA